MVTATHFIRCLEVPFNSGAFHYTVCGMAARTARTKVLAPFLAYCGFNLRYAVLTLLNSISLSTVIDSLVIGLNHIS
jgi:hypothetical protein